MSSRIRATLEFLYGIGNAGELESRIQSLWRKRSITEFSRKSPGRYSEKDALLITYGDQVSEPGFSPLRSLSEFARRHLEGTVSGIHLLPFYPSSSDDGFAVQDYFAVDPALGGWEDVERLGQRFDLMFDGVVNHMSSQSEWFHRFLAGDPGFEDFFVTVEGEPDLSQVVRPRALPLLTEFESVTGLRKVWTTFSADQVDLNYKNPEVLLAVLDVLFFYVSKGARFIRLDAIAFLWKEIGTRCLHLPQTHGVVQLMRAVLDEVAPEVLLITETNVPHAENLSYFGDGTNEAQLVYNFALPPLVLHSLATGNAEKLTAWAEGLKVPSERTTFFNFLASHDGIGLNPVRGILSAEEIEAMVQRTLAHGGYVSSKHNSDGTQSAYELNISYFDALSNPRRKESEQTQIDRFLVAQSVLLALAGVPGIYFHSLFGSRGDRAGAEESGIPRRINRKKCVRGELELELADSTSLRARVFSKYQQLLKIRSQNRAFSPCSKQQVLAINPHVFAILRGDPESVERVLCLHNLSDKVVPIPYALPGVGVFGNWKNLLTAVPFAQSEVLQLGPYKTVWAQP